MTLYNTAGVNMKLPVNYNDLDWRKKKRVREEYVRLQDGKCCHCGGDLNLDPPQEIMDLKINMLLFPPDFFKYPIHLHHCHNTGMTIGAVHSRCNAVLWQYHGE